MATGILCSGVALGVYVPALLLNRGLNTRTIDCRVFVFENYLKKEKQDKIPHNKKLFHSNFKAALVGQKMARPLDMLMDEILIQNLFASWIRENIDTLVIFSGFWLPVVSQFRKQNPGYGIETINIHMDSDISVSWKLHEAEWLDGSNYWLFSRGDNSVNFRIPVGADSVVPWQDRRKCFVVHGGGWGMGNYRDILKECTDAGLELGVVLYDWNEADFSVRNRSYFMMDPDWQPWFTDEKGSHTFPPFSTLSRDMTCHFESRATHHGLFDQVSTSAGIISKPGGGTLLDSLASATPLIFLEPFGEYESKNAELWVSKGLGIMYDEWRSQGFNDRILRTLHENLLNVRNETPDLADILAVRLSGSPEVCR